MRPLTRADAPAYEAFVRGLSAQTLHNRLLGAGLAVTPEGLDRMLSVDQVSHVALVATVKAGGVERIVGVGRYAREADPAVAEFALTVADDWQGRGIGNSMLLALVRRARAQDLRVLFGDVLPTNTAMLKLMVRAGFDLAGAPGDARITRGTRLLKRPRTRRRPLLA